MPSAAAIVAVRPHVGVGHRGHPVGLVHGAGDGASRGQGEVDVGCGLSSAHRDTGCQVPVGGVVVELSLQTSLRRPGLHPVVPRCQAIDGVRAIVGGACTVASTAAIVAVRPHVGVGHRGHPVGLVHGAGDGPSSGQGEVDVGCGLSSAHRDTGCQVPVGGVVVETVPPDLAPAPEPALGSPPTPGPCIV